MGLCPDAIIVAFAPEALIVQTSSPRANVNLLPPGAQSGWLSGTSLWVSRRSACPFGRIVKSSHRLDDCLRLLRKTRRLRLDQSTSSSDLLRVSVNLTRSVPLLRMT